MIPGRTGIGAELALAIAVLLLPQLARGGSWNADLAAVVTFDVLANVHGGLDTGVEVPGNFDLVADLEFAPGEDRFRHRGRIYLLGNSGGNFSELRVGDSHIVSSIEAPNTVKLYEAFYEFESPSGITALLLGLHDLAGEFDVLERGQLQLNSSFGTQPTLSQAMPSIFPTTAPGTRLRFRFGDAGQFLAAVYDGTPGNPSDPYSTHIRFDRGDGIFTIAEIGLADGEERTARKVAVGGWQSTARFDDPAGRSRDANSGAYVIGESGVPGLFDDRIGIFAQFSVARSDRNVVSKYVGGGVHVYEPVSGRPDDQFSIAVAHAHLGRSYRRVVAQRASSETTVELTYLAQLTPWLALQPDLQFIMNPSSTVVANDAVVTGMRIILSLD